MLLVSEFHSGILPMMYIMHVLPDKSWQLTILVVKVIITEAIISDETKVFILYAKIISHIYVRKRDWSLVPFY